tara:strand:+ start:228 stop:503 length:276 start_codon:yes stop_codon:yes gene_type:complete
MEYLNIRICIGAIASTIFKRNRRTIGGHQIDNDVKTNAINMVFAGIQLRRQITELGTQPNFEGRRQRKEYTQKYEEHLLKLSFIYRLILFC